MVLVWCIRGCELESRHGRGWHLKVLLCAVQTHAYAARATCGLRVAHPPPPDRGDLPAAEGYVLVLCGGLPHAYGRRPGVAGPAGATATFMCSEFETATQGTVRGGLLRLSTRRRRLFNPVLGCGNHSKCMLYFVYFKPAQHHLHLNLTL